MLFFDGEQVKTGTFPNKETYVDLKFINGSGKDNEHVVRMEFEGNDDLVNLIFLKGALDDAGFTKVALVAPYFPYSTMDRTEGLRALSCKYVSQVVNRLGFSEVHIKEAHSSVVLATVDRVNNDERSSFRLAKSAIFGLLNAGYEQSNILVVFPDAGAEKRYRPMFGKCCMGNSLFPDAFATATLAKSRDFVSGEIIGMKFVEGEENVKPGMVAVIIDDLCRGGRTFVGAGMALKCRSIDKVILCVTHLENTVFGGAILPGYEVDEIYTYKSSILAGSHEKFHLVSPHIV